MYKHLLRFKLLIGVLSISAVTSPSVLAEPIASDFTAFAGFRLGTVTLGQVEQRMGSVSLVETGEAGEYRASVCYRTPGGSASFLSGELGGPEHQLLGFELSDRAATPACAPWPERIATPPLAIGPLRLGMTLAEYVRRVPAVLHWEHGSVRASFTRVARPVRSASGQRFDVTVSLEATFNAGRLVDLEVWRMETS